MRKAELAVTKKQDDLARAAIERSARFPADGAGFRRADRGSESPGGKYEAALRELEGELAEARAKSDLLLARHRRARANGDAASAHHAMDAQSASSVWDRGRPEGQSQRGDRAGAAELVGDSIKTTGSPPSRNRMK